MTRLHGTHGDRGQTVDRTIGSTGNGLTPVDEVRSRAANGNLDNLRHDGGDGATEEEACRVE